MFDTLRTVICRTPATLAQDFGGAAALVVIFVVGLNLPLLG